MRPHRMCGITEAHLAHEFADGPGMTQFVYACPGVPHNSAWTEEILRRNLAAILHEIYTPWREHDEDGACCREAIKP